MKLSTLNIHFILFLTLSNITAQNLVANGSFERCNKIPWTWMPSDYSFEEDILNWNAPNQSSPDILFPKSFPRFRKRPRIDLSAYEPRTGRIMLGLKLYGCGQTMHCKEHIQVRLREPMRKGYQYMVEYWVKPIGTSIKINNVGFALSSIEVNDTMGFDLYYIDPVYETTAIIRSSEWTKISDTVCVDQDYEYLLIGNFKPDSQTNTFIEKEGLSYAYYFFDDVKVERIEGVCGEITAIEEVIDFNNIQFELKSAQLLSPSLIELDKLIVYLKIYTQINIQINGHTDNIGMVAANQTLSENRALSVVQYLSKQGIATNRLQAKGYGELVPVADNNTDEGRALNRRVEIVVQK